MIFKHKRTEYKIEVDEYQYIFSRRVNKKEDTKNKEPTWRILGYYNDITYLLVKMVRLGCADVKEAKDIGEFMKKSISDLKTTLGKCTGHPGEYKEAYERAKEEVLKINRARSDVKDSV